eukprot:SAG31_NODE_4897_length_2879_cov_1.749281_2_plen_114_part_00
MLTAADNDATLSIRTDHARRMDQGLAKQQRRSSRRHHAVDQLGTIGVRSVNDGLWCGRTQSEIALTAAQCSIDVIMVAADLPILYRYFVRARDLTRSPPHTIDCGVSDPHACK